MRRLVEQRAQAAVVSVVFLAGLVGMAALVLDVGSWYRADRAAQATADAAALAGAQALPNDPAEAEAFARDYARRNGGGVGLGGVTFSSRISGTDTITVEVERATPGFFAKLVNIDSVTVGARASALATGLNAAKYAAPIVVNVNHELMPGGKGCEPYDSCEPTYGEETELVLEHLHKPGSGDAAGAFGLIDLKGGNGSVGTSELASWMESGFDQNMPLGTYNSVPSAKFNSSQFQEALGLRFGREVLFPVYDSIKESGSNAEYNIIGWVGFVPTRATGGGSSSTVHGYFKSVIWQGIRVTSAGQPSFGVRGVSLVE
jgi:Flp pilus assembly protein TadG